MSRVDPSARRAQPRAVREGVLRARCRVLSEAIRSVGHDEDASVLGVQFRSGSVGDDDEPEEVLALLLSDLRRTQASRRVA